MKISQFLNKNSIIADLQATDKKGVIDELALAISKILNTSAKNTAILTSAPPVGRTSSQ